MEKHPLHKAVGKLLKEFAEKNNLEARLDPACDAKSKQNIPLFCGPKAMVTRLCCVDAMLLQKDKVTVIIEIEVSNIKPTQICGKYLTTALSNEYNHDEKSIKIEKNSIDFIQILDTSSPYKEEQFKNIKEAMEKIHSCGCVKNHHIIGIDWKNKKDINELKKQLHKHLTQI